MRGWFLLIATSLKKVHMSCQQRAHAIPFSKTVTDLIWSSRFAFACDHSTSISTWLWQSSRAPRITSTSFMSYFESQDMVHPNIIEISEKLSYLGSGRKKKKIEMDLGCHASSTQLYRIGLLPYIDLFEITVCR